MKTAFWIIIILSLAIYMADTKITFKPFAVTFGRLWFLVAYVLFLGGAFCLRLQYYSEAYEKGLKRGAEIQMEVIKEVKKELEQKTNHN